ncbi:MAG: class I adenylate-forming enzyme family protein [Desulfobacterales bacterium]|nr:class I adenylate-forming enzyme family protein [Desulfobacterales bacterium]MDX2512382.1 class I adenylate-forming enzyme family protein [Desulfobacterales bacterium]
MDSATTHRIADRFRQTVETYSTHTAVIYLGTRYSYNKLHQMSKSFAAALTELGIKRGQRVMIYLPNSIQWVVAWLGIQYIDAVCVPITPIYTPSDIRYIASDCGADAIVCADTNFGYVKQVLPETKIRRVIISRMADLLPTWKRFFGYLFDIVPKGKIALDETTYSLKNLLAQYSPGTTSIPAPADFSGSDIAQILYTGGTTKFPKGVPMGHHLFLRSAIEQIEISSPLFSPQENIVLGNAPLFHILGQTCGLATLLVGGTLLLQPRVNLDATLDAIGRFKAKTMIGVPALYRMMLEHERLELYDLKSVQYWFCAGDVLPVEVGKRWYKHFGKNIFQGYGATETCGGVAMCPVDRDTPPKSVGRVMPSKKVKIVDPAFLEPTKIGTPGELLVSSDPMVTAYLNKPEETSSSFVELDGVTWYRTADIMMMDTDENLYFVDRTVDTIKHKGYRISASEIESVLQEHSAVIGACVVGVPDERVGERIKAYVVLKEDIKGITGYDLITWCRKTLVSYKVPQYIEFRDMLPKSKVGKLLRREIRDEESRRAET